MAMDRATVAAAAAAGATTLMTGLGADELTDWQPFRIGDRIATGRWRAAWAEACAWAGAEQGSPWQIIEQFGVRANLAARLPGYLRWLVPKGPRIPLSAREAPQPAPWILPSFARRHGLCDRLAEKALRSRKGDPSGLAFAMDAIASRVGDVIRRSVAAPVGICTVHPFLDPRVVTFALGVLAVAEPEPDRLKPLLAEATKDLLPERIRFRRRKGHFNEVYYLGLARNLPRIEALVRSPAVLDRGLIDPDALMNCVQSGALGGAGVRALHALNVTLCFLCWLVHEEAWVSERVEWEKCMRLKVTAVDDACELAAVRSADNPEHGISS